MPRLVKRYGSRKLYDTAASRYVALDELAALVREGEQVRVVDNKTGEDVTAAVLTQILSEEGRRGGALSPSFLHDLIRIGERITEQALRAGEQAFRVGEEAVEARLRQAEAGLKHARQGASELVQRLRPGGLTELRDEVDRLRARLDALETSLGDEAPPADSGPSTPDSEPGTPAP